MYHNSKHHLPSASNHILCGRLEKQWNKKNWQILNKKIKFLILYWFRGSDLAIAIVQNSLIYILQHKVIINIWTAGLEQIGFKRV